MVTELLLHRLGIPSGDFSNSMEAAQAICTFLPGTALPVILTGLSSDTAEHQSFKKNYIPNCIF
jgi:hypothetical protein